MRVMWILLVTLLALSCSSSPVPEHRPVPSRIRRAPQFTKGHKTTGTRAPIHLNLRKGEYICGNKICSLRPGQVPPHCDGVCQYKV